MAADLVKNEILPLLAPNFRRILSSCSLPLLSELQEIRLREGRPFILYLSSGEGVLDSKGCPASIEAAYYPTRDDLQRTLQMLSSCSIYAFEEELRRGYLTVPGGIGLVWLEK